MENILNFGIQINVLGDNNAVSALSKISSSFDKINQSTAKVNVAINSSLTSIAQKLGSISLASVIQQVNAVSEGFQSMNKPGLDLSSSMADLSAITGVTGDKLKEIEGYARENAKTFGGSAASSVESFKLVLSQLSPEIAKQPAALKAMGENISTLSKTMGGDTVAATQVLTTAMNQYGVSTDDPIEASRVMAEMMNVMAAAAKEGSAELPQIKSALEQVGGVAKAVGVSFSETNAAIQVLDKAGRKGAEAGVSLRNVMTTLSEGRYLPPQVQKEFAALGINVNALGDKSKTLTERMNLLRPIMGDTALLTKLFGKENILAGQALINQTSEIDRYNTVIQGTKTAVEQAAVVMESPAEKTRRLQARVDDLKISLFNGTNGWIGYTNVLGDVARDVTSLLPIFGVFSRMIKQVATSEKLLSLWTGIVSLATGKLTLATMVASAATKVWAGVQWLLNLALWASPITWIVAGILALIAAIVWVVTCTEGWGEAWEHTVNGAQLIFKAYVESVRFYFNTMVDGIMIGINYIKEGWYKFKEAMGIGDSSENLRLIQQIHDDTEARKKAITDGAKKVAELGLAGGQEFLLAAGSIKLKKEPVGESALGLPTPGKTTKASAGSHVGNKTAEGVATGGKKSTTIQIQFKNMVEELNISGKDFKESVTDMEVQIRESMVRVLGMAVSTAG